MSDPISADFGGKPCHFDLPPKLIPFLEAVSERSAFFILKRFTEGHWLYTDVATIVSMALYGLSQTEKIGAQAVRMGHQLGAPYAKATFSPRPEVLAVLNREGVGNYAELAASVLSRALFGDKAEAA